MCISVPAVASEDPPPILPVRQLSSIKRRIEDWSVRVLSTKLRLANGEMTIKGRRGPKPHFPSWLPGALVPQLPAPFKASAGVLEGLTIGDITWSYQPSESSYEMITAVSPHSRLCCRRF